MKRYRATQSLYGNYKKDAVLYKKYALLFNVQTLKNKEANLILNYHALEKGMLFPKMKKGFGKDRIKKLHRILTDIEVINSISRSQIRVGFQVMCQYYELHQKLGYDIECLYSKKQYEFYKSVLSDYYTSAFNGVINWTKETFYKDVKADFGKFANSRKSIRNYTGEMISKEMLGKVVNLANTAPSVCNRQASNVYLVENKEKIDQILEIQGGFNGYTQDVNQLLIVTNDRSYYYTPGERHQLYIDGGIFLMNLLYALHFYEIGNCPANWGKTVQEEAPMEDLVNIPKSEKIICIVPIGRVQEEFCSTLSERRPSRENFMVLS